jgi:hypothetical protein
MNKNLFFGLFLMLVSVSATSQSDNLKAINRDVWVPFMESYGTFNGVKYKSLQSEDFMRAAANNKNMPSSKEYFEGIDAWFANLKKEGRKLTINFRFTERFSSANSASEQGVFELKAFDSSGKELWKNYSKFHTFLRKTNDVWKIVIDYDTNQKSTVDEKAYLAASAIDNFEKS